VVLLAGAATGGGKPFFSGFLTLEFNVASGDRMPEDVWDGEVPLIMRRLLDLVRA
jgi:hypothetical protein